jgi:hypothetical protein
VLKIFCDVRGAAAPTGPPGFAVACTHYLIIPEYNFGVLVLLVAIIFITYSCRNLAFYKSL